MNGEVVGMNRLLTELRKHPPQAQVRMAQWLLDQAQHAVVNLPPVDGRQAALFE